MRSHQETNDFENIDCHLLATSGLMTILCGLLLVPVCVQISLIMLTVGGVLCLGGLVGSLFHV